MGLCMKSHNLIDGKSVRQYILNEHAVTAEKSLEAVQSGVFAGIFSALTVLVNGFSHTAKVAIFPAGTLVTFLREFQGFKRYKKSKNKNINSRFNVSLGIFSAIAEGIAVGFALLGTVAFAAVAPVIFVCLLSLRFLDHTARALYYGFLCARSWKRGETYTKEHAQNKKLFIKNTGYNFLIT